MYSQHCTTRNTVPSMLTMSIIVLAMTGVFIDTACIAAMDTTPDASSKLVLSSVSVLAYMVLTSLVPMLVDTATMLAVLPTYQLVYTFTYY